MRLRYLGVALGLGLALSSPAFALHILVTNDDGLTSNIKALYETLKAHGHDVIVSVPCTNQSGRGAAIVMYSTTVIVPDNDKTQIEAAGGCRNGVAATGAPAVGPFAKSGYANDYFYVHGSPVMATMYGLDVLAPARWGRAPDLVLSGPNEGQNVGRVINSSGTIGNAQFAAGRGIASIALSAGSDTTDDKTLANPYSTVVAELSLRLVDALAESAARRGAALLPEGLALNVNFPNAPTPALKFAFARIGSFELYDLHFRNTPPYGFSLATRSTDSAAPAQRQDEAIVQKNRIAVSAMQVGFEARPVSQQWLRANLGDLLGDAAAAGR